MTQHVAGGRRQAPRHNGAHPMVGQRAPELQSFGTITSMPNGLDANLLGPLSMT